MDGVPPLLQAGGVEVGVAVPQDHGIDVHRGGGGSDSAGRGGHGASVTDAAADPQGKRGRIRPPVRIAGGVEEFFLGAKVTLALRETGLPKKNFAAGARW